MSLATECCYPAWDLFLSYFNMDTGLLQSWAQSWIHCWVPDHGTWLMPKARNVRSAHEAKNSKSLETFFTTVIIFTVWGDRLVWWPWGTHENELSIKIVSKILGFIASLPASLICPHSLKRQNSCCWNIVRNPKKRLLFYLRFLGLVHLCLRNK